MSKLRVYSAACCMSTGANKCDKPVVDVARDAQCCVHTRDSSCRGQTLDGHTDGQTLCNNKG